MLSVGMLRDKEGVPSLSDPNHIKIVSEIEPWQA